MSVKKKVLAGFAIAFVALLIVVGVFTSLQRDNIAAYWESQSSTSEELAQKVEQEKEKLRQQLEEFIPDSMRDLTNDEEMQLITGKITVADADELMGITDSLGTANSGSTNNSGGTNNGGTNNGGTNGGSGNTQNTSKEDKVAKVITNATANLYSAKSSFLGKIGTIVDSAINEFNTLPTAEKNSSTKASILTKHMVQAGKLESQCDDRVEAVLKSLESQLKALGSDTSIVASMQSSYQNEKAAKKAYYLNKI